MSQDDFDKGYRHGHAEADVDCYNITQKLNEELSALTTERDALREGLIKAERTIWANSDTYWECCGGEINVDSHDNLLGHKPDCWLSKLLGEEEGRNESYN
jgi:hypothetical protein